MLIGNIRIYWAKTQYNTKGPYLHFHNENRSWVGGSMFRHLLSGIRKQFGPRFRKNEKLEGK